MKPIIIIGIVAIVAAALVLLLVLPAVTVTKSASYGIDYQGYAFAKSAGVGSDGQPILEEATSSFAQGEDVYLVIYGISGLKTEAGSARISMDLAVTGASGAQFTDSIPSVDYPAPNGQIDNVYGYVSSSNVGPGKSKIQVTLRDLIGGGFATVEAEFIVA